MLNAIIWIIYLLIGQTIATTTPPSIPITSNNAIPPPLNLTTNPQFPDHRFSVSPAFGPTFLPPIPTLMNVLFFIAETAYGDYNDTVDPNVWIAPLYSEVQIATEKPIVAKYLLFGAFSAVEYMYRYNRFQEGQWVLKWDRNEVGRLWILSDSLQLKLPGTNNTQDQFQPPLTQSSASDNKRDLSTNDLLNTTNPSETDVDIEVSPITGGSSLNRYEVFLCLYTAILHLAQCAADVRILNLKSMNPSGSVTLTASTTRWGIGVYGWLQALILLPQRMLESMNPFREASFDLVEDQVKVLDGTVKKRGG